MAGVAVSPVLIGRRAEFETLRAALAEGRAGRPRVVIVRGEAGIGKTRLIDDAIGDESNVGFGERLRTVVTIAHCVDGGGAALPLHPVRRMVADLHQALGDDLPALVAASTGTARTLSLLAPEIAGVAPDAAYVGDEAAPDPVAEAVETLVEALSEQVHLVIVIEDLQNADAATAAFAAELATTLRGRHVTLFLTYRPDERAETSLRDALAAIEGQRRVDRIELRRLSLDEVEELVEAIMGDGPPHADIEVIAERSGGVPFLVEELVALEGKELPGALRDLLLQRYRGLDEASRRIVGLMAAGTGEVDHVTIESIAGVPEPELQGALRRAVEAGILEIHPQGYTFRHALLREAVYSQLLPGERRSAHRTFARARTALGGSSFDALAEVADHWWIAGDRVEAFDAAVRAVAHPRADLVPSATARLGRRLAEIWHEVPDPEQRAGASRMEVLRRAGEAHWQAGDYVDARATLDAALAVPGPYDPFERAETLWLAALVRSWFNEDADATLLEQAKALLAPMDAPSARALLARVVSMGAGDDPVVLAKAVAIARTAGDADTVAVCLTNLSWQLLRDGDDAAATDAAAEAVAVGQGAEVRHRASLALGDILMVQGRYDDAAAVFESTRRYAIERGRERGFGALATAGLAEALLALGRPDASAAHCRRALQLLAVPIDRSFALRIRSEADLWGDRLAAYRDIRRVVLETMPEVAGFDEEDADWRRLDLLANLVELTDARDSGHRAELLGRSLALAEDLLAPGLAEWTRMSALSLAAWLLSEAGTGLGQRTASVRRNVDESLSVLRNAGRLTPLVGFVDAELRAGDGADGNQRRAAWQGVADSLSLGGGMPVQFVDLALLRLADAQCATGDRAGAASTLSELTERARRHGAELIVRWSAELAARAHIGIDARTRVESLTERETQVLALVARGLTNPQIGRELFISPKTAAIHVSSILMKLGAANRTEAAALYRDALSRQPDGPAVAAG